MGILWTIWENQSYNTWRYQWTALTKFEGNIYVRNSSVLSRSNFPFTCLREFYATSFTDNYGRWAQRRPSNLVEAVLCLVSKLCHRIKFPHEHYQILKSVLAFHYSEKSYYRSIMYSVLLLATPLTIYSAVDSEWQCQCALVNKMATATVCISRSVCF